MTNTKRKPITSKGGRGIRAPFNISGRKEKLAERRANRRAERQAVKKGQEPDKRPDKKWLD